MDILSQSGESTLKDFKPSPMNHGKESVVGQLVPVEFNRLTVSETVSIDDPVGEYMEMLEHKNSARGHLIAIEVLWKVLWKVAMDKVLWKVIRKR